MLVEAEEQASLLPRGTFELATILLHRRSSSDPATGSAADRRATSTWTAVLGIFREGSRHGSFLIVFMLLTWMRVRSVPCSPFSIPVSMSVGALLHALWGRMPCETVKLSCEGAGRMPCETVKLSCEGAGGQSWPLMGTQTWHYYSRFFLILVLVLEQLKYNKQYCAAAGKLLILPVSCQVQYCSTQLGIGKAGLQRSRDRPTWEASRSASIDH
jgi:hypothetical protein